jgi:hypothetical protein
MKRELLLALVLLAPATALADKNVGKLVSNSTALAVSNNQLNQASPATFSLPKGRYSIQCDKKAAVETGPTAYLTTAVNGVRLAADYLFDQLLITTDSVVITMIPLEAGVCTCNIFKVY